MSGLEQMRLETGTVYDAYKKMNERSDEMNNFLDTVRVLLEDVNDQDKNMYVGDKAPSQLRDELEAFAREFAPVYEQIKLFAGNIDTIVKTSTQQ